jgi:eukaryotic-like serine/threonine-protein kinase
VSDSPERRIGRYELRRELGRGMMGVVYEAVDPLLQRPVALKTVHPTFAATPEDRDAYEKRFFAEARAVARLSHPGIVMIHDIGQDADSGAFFIALELLRGRTLADVALGQPLPWRDALPMLAQLASALHHAHAAGVIHRDVKPENIMVLESGAVKLMDFGIARIESAQLTAAGQVFGTPRYMSPEQAHGDPVDARSDLFALGSIAYLVLTGHHAFGAPSVPRVLAQVVGEQPPPPSARVAGIPPEVDAIVAKALAKNASARYQAGQEMALDIEDVLAGGMPRHASVVLPDHPLHTLLEMPDDLLEEVPTSSIPPEVRPALRPDTRRDAWVPVALVTVALALVLLFTTRSPRPSTTEATTAPPPAVPVTTVPPATAPLAEERAVDTARLAFDFEHSLKRGRVRVLLSEKVVIDQAFQADPDKKARRGFTRQVDVPPGAHDVRVEVTWDDNRKSAATASRFKAGTTRRLQARIGGLLKKLSVEWK